MLSHLVEEVLHTGDPVTSLAVRAVWEQGTVNYIGHSKHKLGRLGQKATLVSVLPSKRGSIFSETLTLLLKHQSDCLSILSRTINPLVSLPESVLSIFK